MDAHQVSHHASLQGKAVRRLLRRGGRARIGKLLAKMRVEDVAIMLRGFTPAEQFDVFRILAADFSEEAPQVLLELDPPSRLGILEQLEPPAIASLIGEVASDDAVFLLDSLPDALRDEVLAIAEVEAERFSDLHAQLVYADDTAGRIMDTDFVALADTTSVAEATTAIREMAQDIEMISYLYVIDDLGRLVGVTPLRNLLLAQPSATLRELMNPSVIHVHTATDQEEVAQLASRYDLLAIPVTDEGDRLVGIVTIDDIVDIVKAEATEDFYKMAGTSDDELIYEDRSWKVAGIRLPWILFNLVGLLFAGLIVGRFEAAFESGLSVAVLVGFIPVIMGMAGNIGSQTSTIAVRGLATGRLQLTEGDVRRFTWQQLKVGAILGVACSGLVAVAAATLGESLVIPVAVGLSLFFTVQLASLNGVLIPVLFERLGFDPAVASGPLVTTSNDVLGVLIYFSLTTALFGWLGA